MVIAPSDLGKRGQARLAAMYSLLNPSHNPFCDSSMPSMEVPASAIIWKTNTSPDGGVFHTPVMRFNHHLWAVKIDQTNREIELVKPIID